VAVLDVAVLVPNEPPEYLSGLPIGLSDETDDGESNDALVRAFEARSVLIQLIPEGPRVIGGPRKPGPKQLEWELTLQQGTDVVPSIQEYLAGMRKLGDEDTVELGKAPSLEVSLVAVPGLYDDLNNAEEQEEVVLALTGQAERLHDRLALIDVPTDPETTAEAIREAEGAIHWISTLRSKDNEKAMRAAAVYYPRLWVPDPLGGIANPLRSVPPSGHVAGLISRLDRQRGPHHTPANAPLFEAVDVTRSYEPAEQIRLNDEGINLVRCFSGRGLLVWGGRTADRDPLGRFVAHRRLIHRLVKAIRQVAEPLVFDTNGPELWLTLVRAITTVLLEAYRAGALKGSQPDEAFRVRCDETTTTPEERDLGRLYCEIEVAPAAPMEFILLRAALGAEGLLEIIEA
jgi:phage tail sheath protein FI